MLHFASGNHAAVSAARARPPLRCNIQVEPQVFDLLLYFADGIVEDILTGLSRIKWLFVVARNSSFVYKGQAVDVKRVRRELGVRYVLEGSIRKTGEGVRIAAQLLEAETGGHLWAERYDRRLEGIFALQDEITLSVGGAIEPSLRDAEIERVKRKRPENLDAYDFVLCSASDPLGLFRDARTGVQGRTIARIGSCAGSRLRGRPRLARLVSGNSVHAGRIHGEQPHQGHSACPSCSSSCSR
jgi:TolB-like protein